MNGFPITPDRYYEAVNSLETIKPAQRVKRLEQMIRDSMMQNKQSWNITGTVLDSGTEQLPVIIRKAMAIKRKLEEVPIGMWEGQLVAGSFALFDEGLMLGGDLPKYATDSEIEAASRHGLSVWSIVGHIVPSYPKLLKYGVSGITAMAGERHTALQDADKRSFYEAVIIALEGLAAYALRHADLCETLAASTDDNTRRQELLGLAGDLRHSPINPPKTLSQALNAIWITHVAFQLTGNCLAIGRIDQFVEPYLQADLEAGRLNVETAQELIDCFFLKFNERSVANNIARVNTDIKKTQERFDRNWSNRSPFDHSTQKFNVRDSIDSTNHWLQNVIVGGVKPEDGSDATNLATIMCLEAFKRNRMTNPCITVRLNRKSPDCLLKMLGSTLMTGGGLPAIFNDEAIIKSLVKNGFPEEDARDYTNDGCWEVLVPGRTDFYFDRFNMLKCLEWTLNRGCSRIDGKREAPDIGDPMKFESYEQLMDGFKSLLDYELEGLMRKISENFGKRAMIAPTPLLSALLEGPMENGRDMTAGGARFITYGLIAEGLSHLIDSLSAIRKVIYDEGRASMGQLLDALDHNFDGNRELQLMMDKAPKYGNNDDYADSIGQEVIKYFTAKVEELNEHYNKIRFLPGVGTFSWYIAIGEGSGTSPDGRLSGEAVSSNFSPSVNAAKRGVTGAILSHSRMNTSDLPVGSPIDLRVSSKLLSGKSGEDRLAGLIKSFVELGGNMLTLTITDSETLKKAQTEPEKYSDLRVRMGGWSAYFTMLSKEQQEHHISKQENL